MPGASRGSYAEGPHRGSDVTPAGLVKHEVPAPSSDDRLVASAVRKSSRRLLPFLFVLYVAAFLDRINVGFAQLQMKDTLGFGDSVYGLGTGVFFIGYFLFEVPSNLILARTGARLWIARIMISWGLNSAAMALV